MVMYRNGIIIQSIKNNGYKGVDGSGFSADSAENWYLNNYQDCADFEEYYDEYINRTYYNTDEKSFVAVCNDWNYIEKYITESKKRGIPFRIILCETEIPKQVFLGAAWTDYVKTFKEECISPMKLKRIQLCLEKAKLERSWKTNREHVAQLKQRHQQKSPE